MDERMSEDAEYTTQGVDAIIGAIEVSRIHTRAGDLVILRNERTELWWEPGGQLAVRSLEGNSRVAGGPLLELAPAHRRGQPTIYGLGRAPDGDGVPITERFADALGAGAMLRRRFPVAVQPLVVACVLRLYDQHRLACLDITLHNAADQPLALRRIFPFVAGAWWNNSDLTIGGRTHHFALSEPVGVAWPPTDAPVAPASARPRFDWPRANNRPRGPFGETAEAARHSVAILESGAAGSDGMDVGAALLVGFIQGQHCQVLLRPSDGAVAATLPLDDATLPPQGTLALPRLVVGVGPARELLAAYSQMQRR